MKGIYMNKNLKSAVKKQQNAAEGAELELLSHLKSPVVANHLNNVTFDYLIDCFYRDVKEQISHNSFGYNHPSDVYDAKDLDSIKEFLNLSNNYRGSSSESEGKWDYLEDIRDRFKENYNQKINSFDISSLESFNTLYNVYKTKVNKQTKITKDEFAKLLTNSALFTGLQDTNYFNCSG